jgi:hypothetical protein
MASQRDSVQQEIMQEQTDDLDTLNAGLEADDDRIAQVISVRILFYMYHL